MKVYSQQIRYIYSFAALAIAFFTSHKFSKYDYKAYLQHHGAAQRLAYLAIHLVAVVLDVHFDELAVDALEHVEEVAHQHRLAYLR